MKKVTVFTPTYNRASLLEKLYQSLLTQTNKSFVWLIVDDGSTDNTKNVVTAFQNENKIEINYIFQENGGKHVAHNTGVNNCKTDIFYCVDSDDYLSDDCIEIILNNWQRVADDDLLAGMIALKKDINKKEVITPMPKNIERASIYNLYNKHFFKGDAAIIFKSSVIKQYLFPVFENEKFVTEGAVYDLISQDYDMLLINKVIYYYEYLNDGYSVNIHQVHLKSPLGYIFFLKQRISLANNKAEYKQAVVDYIAGTVMVCRNPFKNAPIPVLDMFAVAHRAVIKIIKMLVKSLLFKRM